jgi:site-specific recombinase XerD
MNIIPSIDKNRINQSGTVKIRICITVNGHRTYLPTPHQIIPDGWDTTTRKVIPSVVNHQWINSDIRRRIYELESKLIEAGYQNKHISPSGIRSLMKGKSPTGVFEYGTRLVNELSGKYSPDTLSNYKSELKRFNQFFPGITFDEVKVEHLRKYEQHLIGMKLANNTIHKSWKVLKKIFNSARRDEITNHYPFRNFDNPKYIQTDRTHLSQSEVEKIEAAMDLPMSQGMKISALFFLFGCYSGLRFSDWQRFNPAMVREGRLILRAKKNGELVSLKIHPLLEKVIEQIQDLPRGVMAEQKTNEELKGLSKLAGIDKKITTHVARHSFAVRCAELGISIETTAALMGITVKTCTIYYKITNRKIDSEFEKWDRLSPGHKNKK